MSSFFLFDVNESLNIFLLWKIIGGKMKKILIFVLLLCVSLSWASEQTRDKTMLKITGFTEDSNLQKAGAKVGDFILKYNGTIVHKISTLSKLKEQVNSSQIHITILREVIVQVLVVPKGQLGAYLKEVQQDHPIDQDAVIIDGIGKLGWKQGMENSFHGCVTLLEEKYGDKTSYADILGLSGYVFRTHFFDRWCPSSPDATVGYNTGEKVLNLLGYKYNVYHSSNENEQSMEKGLTTQEMTEEIKKGIDNGYPVIAIDLIEVPEWGLITGYQKNGKELFCRTYFDKTDGYEIAQKKPWAIFVLEGKKKAQFKKSYKKSLQNAKELYTSKKYDNYFSGIKATEEWIAALEDKIYFKDIEPDKFAEMKLANWWTYYSLMGARAIGALYLKNNAERFEMKVDKIEELEIIYKQESEFLMEYFNEIPSPHNGFDKRQWNHEERLKQAEILKEFLNFEKEVKQLLDEL
jgi:hypothetical protein